MNIKPWTTFEHRIAASNLTNEDVARVLGRSVEAVRGYRSRNDMDGNPKKWKPWEELLLHYYPILNIKDFGLLLPHRTKDAINTRMVSLGIVESEDNNQFWTPSEDRLLLGLNRLTVCSRAYVRLLFTRARSVVENRMRLLGIQPHDRRVDLQTLDKARLLRMLLRGCSYERILEEFSEIRPYVLKHQLKLYSEQLGVPVKGLE